MSRKNTRPETEYVYSSSEMAKFYGLTSKAIQFYEEKGLLHPQRLGPSNIRRYDLRDSYCLYYTRLYHNCGVSVNQVIDLLQHNTADHITGTLEQHMVNMEKQILIQQHMLRHMREIQSAFLHAAAFPHEHTIIETSDGFYRLYLRHFAGQHISDAQETQEYQKWNQLLPIVRASMLFPLKDMLNPVESFDTQIGVIISESDFRRFDLQHGPRVTYYPAGRYVRSVIRGSDLRLDDPQYLAPAMAYIRSNGLTICGDAFTRLLYVIRDGQNLIRYDEVFIPIH